MREIIAWGGCILIDADQVEAIDAPKPGKLRSKLVVLPYMKKEVFASRSDFYVKVEVFWGGKKQDDMLISLQHWYQR